MFALFRVSNGLQVFYLVCFGWIRWSELVVHRLRLLLLFDVFGCFGLCWVVLVVLC